MTKLAWEARERGEHERYETSAGNIFLWVERSNEPDPELDGERVVWWSWGVTIHLTTGEYEAIVDGACSWVSLEQAQEMAEAIARILDPKTYENAHRAWRATRLWTAVCNNCKHEDPFNPNGGPCEKCGSTNVAMRDDTPAPVPHPRIALVETVGVDLHRELMREEYGSEDER